MNTLTPDETQTIQAFCRKFALIGDDPEKLGAFLGQVEAAIPGMREEAIVAMLCGILRVAK